MCSTSFSRRWATRFVRVCVRVCARANIRSHTHAHAHMHWRTRTRTHEYAYTCVCLGMRVCVWVYVCVFGYIGGRHVGETGNPVHGCPSENIRCHRGWEKAVGLRKSNGRGYQEVELSFRNVVGPGGCSKVMQASRPWCTNLVVSGKPRSCHVRLFALCV